MLRNSLEERRSQKNMLGLGKSPYIFYISFISPEIPLIERKITWRFFRENKYDLGSIDHDSVIQGINTKENV